MKAATGRRVRRSPLDAAHLTRQTLGDKALAAELLALFAAQARHVLLALDGAPGAAEAADLAHALVGAARAVGAGAVARAAETAEAAARQGGTAWVPARAALAEAVAAALAALPRPPAG